MFRITEDPSSWSLDMDVADHVHVNGHGRTILVILAKYCTRLPDDGSSCDPKHVGVLSNIL